MFSKTRRRIVFTVVGSLLALMVITLATIYVSNRVALTKRSDEMLRTYAERYFAGERAPSNAGPGEGPENRPGEISRPTERDDEPWKKESQFRLSTFYAVVYSSDGEVESVDNENNAVRDEESLIKLASSILASKKKSGRAGNISYLVDERAGRTLVAMIDATIDNSNQSALLCQMLVIGGAALAVLVVISVFIARRIVRPLEENDRHQKRFVSDAGHELKTPIAVISANCELQRGETGGSEWLDNIEYENERMSDLVKQLLALSRAESGEMQKETLDLSRLVEGETLPFESLAYEKGKKIDSRVEPDIKVKGNANSLRRLVSILLDNALSHGKGETVALSLEKGKKDAVLTVENEADEISEEKLSHLFERFYRADGARGDEGSHYGLGLSIAKAVADAHDGTIRAEYKNGRAVFTVSFPIIKN